MTYGTDIRAVFFYLLYLFIGSWDDYEMFACFWISRVVQFQGILEEEFMVTMKSSLKRCI